MSDNRFKNYVLNQLDAVMLNCSTVEEYQQEIDALLDLALDLQRHAADDYAETHEEARAVSSKTEGK